MLFFSCFLEGRKRDERVTMGDRDITMTHFGIILCLVDLLDVIGRVSMTFNFPLSISENTKRRGCVAIISFVDLRRKYIRSDPRNRSYIK